MTSDEFSLQGDPKRSRFTPGTEVGIYRIDSALGEGGMGTVYRALDTKLNRPVAIKFLSDELADASARRRFQREAQMASSLNHPHIVTVYDVGEFGGRQYLVTEFVDGGTLKDWAGSQKRTWREVVELLTGVADGLATAHGAGILHRDIKPQNVLISKSGYAKLADFGLAKLESNSTPNGSAPDGDTRTLTEGMTRPGMVVGTIAYMSPEQASGQRLDARSDVFSFGVLLYEMVAGRRPFEGRSGLEVLRSILDAPAPPLGNEIPGPVRAVIEKALEKDPAERYQTMQEMVVDLRRLLRQAVEAEHAANQMWKRAAAVAVLAVAALAVWKYWPASGGSRFRTIAVLPLQNLSGDPNQEPFSDGTTEALISDLSQIHSLAVISRTSVMRFKGTTKPIREIARELPADAFVTGSWQRTGGRVRITAQLINASTERNVWAREYERDNADVLRMEDEVAQAIAREIKAEVTPEEAKLLASAKSVNPAAYDEFLLGRYLSWKTGPDDYKQSIAHFERAVQIDPNYAPAHAGLSMAWTMRFGSGYVGFSEAEGPARAGAVRALQVDPDLAEAHAAAAHVDSVFDWDWASAEKSFRRALELNPDSLETCYCFAIFLTTQGRFQEALDNVEHAVKLNPLSANVQTQYGAALLYARRAEEAMPHLRRAIELDPQGVLAYIFLAAALELSGKTEEMLKLVQPFGPTAPLAVAYVRLGRRSDALKVIHELKDPMDLAQAYTALADSNRAVQSIAKALDQHEFRAQFIKVWPEFDSLRSDPRFQAQVARLKIPDASR
jgi:serine/threonine protein kinase